jgi:uncharacterized protein (TIGR03437 family)
VTLPFMRSGSVALDAAGNGYLTGVTTAANYPVKDSLAPCGSVFLSVFDPAGNLIQSTYVEGYPDVNAFTFTALGLGPNSTVYVAGPAKGNPLVADGPVLLARLSPAAAAHPVSLACLGNAGSFDVGPIAPGEILSLFGQGLGPATGMQPDVSPDTGFPTQLAKVAVTFDGIPGPLLYVQDGQINAIAPWRLSPGQTTQVCVFYNGTATNCIQRVVVQAAPGVFMADSTHAATLNQNGSINSATNPAQPGSIVSIFATGLGLLTPVPANGSILAPPLPTNVVPVVPGTFIGGIASSLVPIQTTYAGPAPFEVAGFSQINISVASGTMFVAVGQNLYTESAMSNRFVVYVANPRK